MQKNIFLFLFLLKSPVCLFSQDVDKVITGLDVKLAKGQTSISDILSDSRYMYLHAQIPFRQLVKRYAKPGRLKIITDAEPGKKINVKGKIEGKEGKALNNALVYFYHTSDKGWYSDTAAHIMVGEGDRGHARLFGYLRTDNKGQFEFETIQAKGYPQSDFPAHIHIMVWKDNMSVTGLPNELQFDDDPRLTPERKARSLSDGNLIEKNTGSAANPVYFYSIKLK